MFDRVLKSLSNESLLSMLLNANSNDSKKSQNYQHVKKMIEKEAESRGLLVNLETVESSF